MKWFLEHQELNRYWLVIRFLGIAIITVFLLMAVSLDLVSVLEIFFGIHLNSWESLSYVALAYMSVVILYLVTSFTDSYLRSEDSQIKLPLVFWDAFLLSIPIILFLMAYELNHPFDDYNYLPGELARRKLTVTGFVFIIVFIEAIATATFDLMKQLNRAGNDSQP